MPHDPQPAAPTQQLPQPPRVFRDLSLPKIFKGPRNSLYLQVQDVPGSKADNNVCRPSTLRHSWYKAVPHHFADTDDVHIKLHELRIKELKLVVEQKVDHALLLNQYQVPLQALLDTVLDDKSNFVLNLTNSRDHICEGKAKKQKRQWETLINRPCNKLCYLTPEARKQVLSIEN